MHPFKRHSPPGFLGTRKVSPRFGQQSTHKRQASAIRIEANMQASVRYVANNRAVSADIRRQVSTRFGKQSTHEKRAIVIIENCYHHIPFQEYGSPVGGIPGDVSFW